ncbi:hypothetical protein [Moorella sp. Hama-1]|uniref:hypothetical protein n=1 Tax=Moorella sp. Hama-1 TaxID=2138101 RepID=UPI000D650F72|nr:hypothetical protein [Moorella sp. Hama-1]MDN5362126.1 hypothetical protein [Moorella sp. (in: firmicutes)]BCV20246.1 hypothetical protein hamaS1_03150 [Moorella sp. Hama-1]
MGLEQRLNELEARVNNLERKFNAETEVDFLRKELSQPVDRSAEDIEQALKIIGMGEGPRDMAKNFRRYLYEGKQ